MLAPVATGIIYRYHSVMSGKACCTPRSDRKQSSNILTENTATAAESSYASSLDTVVVEGGAALVGTNKPLISSDEESPLREIDIHSFRIMRTAVTNSMFREFIENSGYKTEAEKFGWSFVFDSDDYVNARHVSAEAPWWRQTKSATWDRIDGINAIQADLDDHPVVHVSWNDANAFAKWAGGRLPLEREWEHAARGGQGDVLFPWGNREPDDQHYTPCNVWQGQFPENNTELDGYRFTAPAQSFDPNPFGLYNMCGNVWEWTAQSYKVRSHASGAKVHKKRMRGTKVLKGGSFLCHRSYCYRYRIAARTGNTPDSTTSHQGFRLVFDN